MKPSRGRIRRNRYVLAQRFGSDKREFSDGKKFVAHFLTSVLISDSQSLAFAFISWKSGCSAPCEILALATLPHQWQNQEQNPRVRIPSLESLSQTQQFQPETLGPISRHERAIQLLAPLLRLPTRGPVCAIRVCVMDTWPQPDKQLTAGTS